mmetsp:Transcript_111009/g.319005  ORF Transcript_111009/g.319005 Transcript_111009/m.319005 type:complete len:335 (+) Transcript_111009:3-1007(+)
MGCVAGKPEPGVPEAAGGPAKAAAPGGALAPALTLLARSPTQESAAKADSNAQNEARKVQIVDQPTVCQETGDAEEADEMLPSTSRDRRRKGTPWARGADVVAILAQQQAEEEEEEEPAAPAEDEDEEPEERERKKLARLRKLLNENDHDSSDEAEASMRNASCSAAPHGASAALLQRLGAFVDAVRAKPNLTAVECRGDCIPADVQREIARAVQDHCEAQERRRQTQEARGARTAYDALRDQMAELAGFAAAETAGDALGGELLPGEEAGPDGVTRMGIRRFVGRRLFAALGEALFECQRFKSKENEAVADWQGECAFLAMYIRKLAKEKDRK